VSLGGGKDLPVGREGEERRKRRRRRKE